MVKMPEETPIERLHKIATECARQGANNEAACAMLAEAVAADAGLRELLLTPWEPHAIRDLIGEKRRRDRAVIWSRPKAADARVDLLRRASVRMSLMDFPLPNGTRLGNATGEDLAEGSATYKAQASDMAAKAKWLDLIAAGLPEGKTVGEALTETDLERLRDEV